LSTSQVEQSDPEQVISSSRIDRDVIASPDGTQLAFTSDRTGALEIFVSSIDGSDVVQLSSFGGLRGGISDWSPDGQLIGFDSRIKGQAEVYVIDAESGVHRRLTSHSGQDVTPHFSSDGKWVYFTSTRSGQPGVWKTPTGGGEAVWITDGGLARESPDGKHLYFTRPIGRLPELWRMSLVDGKEEKVLEEIGHSYGYEPILDGVFFRTERDISGGDLVNYLDPASGKLVLVGRIPRLGDITPDGKKMFFSRIDREGSDIMLVENFH
jgi:Tol biopolymer transport system component